MNLKLFQIICKLLEVDKLNDVLIRNEWQNEKKKNFFKFVVEII